MLFLVRYTRRQKIVGFSCNMFRLIVSVVALMHCVVGAQCIILVSVKIYLLTLNFLMRSFTAITAWAPAFILRRALNSRSFTWHCSICWMFAPLPFTLMRTNTFNIWKKKIESFWFQLWLPFLFILYLWLFTKDNLFNSNEQLSIRVLPSLRNTYKGCYGISNY